MIIKGIILCEGASDQVLIGEYLKKIKCWSFMRAKKDFPFLDQDITWYVNSDEDYFAIWSVNGSNFNDAVSKIFELEKYEHTTESLVIITDHDDETATSNRPQEIYNTINSVIPIDNYEPNVLIKNNNNGQELSYTAGCKRKVKI